MRSWAEEWGAEEWFGEDDLVRGGRRVPRAADGLEGGGHACGLGQRNGGQRNGSVKTGLSGVGGEFREPPTAWRASGLACGLGQRNGGQRNGSVKTIWSGAGGRAATRAVLGGGMGAQGNGSVKTIWSGAGGGAASRAVLGRGMGGRGMVRWERPGLSWRASGTAGRSGAEACSNAEALGIDAFRGVRSLAGPTNGKFARRGGRCPTGRCIRGRGPGWPGRIRRPGATHPPWSASRTTPSASDRTCGWALP